MAQLYNINEFSKEEKILLLRELGYDSDGEYVLDKNGGLQLDKYIGLPIKIENMFIYPENVMILDNNPLSIVSFLEEYGEAV